MEKMNFIQPVLEKLESLKDKFLEYYEENKKLTLMISALVIVILLCIIMILCMIPSSKNKKNTTNTFPLVLTETMQVPKSPELPDSYIISRKTESFWSDDEAKDWFTIPSQKEINALSQSNENMINELLGATP